MSAPGTNPIDPGLVPARSRPGPISEIRLKNAAGDTILHLNPSHLTVFVGPNNSGKSLALREIANFLRREGQVLRLVAGVDTCNIGSREELDAEVAPFLVGEDTNGNRYYQSTPGSAAAGPMGGVRGWQPNPHEDHESLWRSAIAALHIMNLDGRQRLDLLADTQAQDPRQPSGSVLGKLLQSDQLRSSWRAKVHAGLGLYPVVDPTAMSTLRIRVSDRPPVSVAEERGISPEAIAFHDAAPLLGEFSDGVKAYAGILAAVMAAPARVLLIDEPEAFLHPPLARKLGVNLAGLAQERSGNVVVATHSPSFLMGCVQSGADVQVVRLTYDAGIAKAQMLDTNAIASFVTDPLLRSTDVLGAVFHAGAVVTEAETDRAFYDEINSRLIFENSGGHDGITFLHARNWQTVRKIVGPLRGLGVPAAAVVDLDVFGAEGSEFPDLLAAVNFPEIQRNSAGMHRADVWKAFELLGGNRKAGRELAKAKGLSPLDPSSLESASNFLATLQEYGLFVVRVGEVERWLAALCIPGKGSDWLIPMFERMGRDRQDPGYIRPAAGDVWAFIRGVGAWIANPNRKGMPG